MSFMIIGKDAPVYDLDLSSRVRRDKQLSTLCKEYRLHPLITMQREDIARASQFIMHAALDMVDAAVLTTPST
jgi:hypothetical protein